MNDAFNTYQGTETQYCGGISDLEGNSVENSEIEMQREKISLTK